jgi:hypothetical protein
LTFLNDSILKDSFPNDCSWPQHVVSERLILKESILKDSSWLLSIFSELFFLKNSIMNDSFLKDYIVKDSARPISWVAIIGTFLFLDPTQLNLHWNFWGASSSTHFHFVPGIAKLGSPAAGGRNE